MIEPTRLRLAEIGDLPFIFRQEREYIDTIEPDAYQGWQAALDLNLAFWIDCLHNTLFCIDADGHPLGYAMWSLDGDTASLVSINVLGSVVAKDLNGSSWMRSSSGSAQAELASWSSAFTVPTRHA
ncbi:hypothetical protein [Arthrobacter yangruifuii]|uniref:hypothetical protein n=1 Tax=Arthrobacter yangruifuii TaxID=2606616 RepID=UPI0011B57FE4|nr:hypothetical protein [Arthrobacter yangruifuii]